jgi:hypothetical protein
MKKDFGLQKRSLIEGLTEREENFRLKFLKAVVIILVAAFIVIAFKSELPRLTNFIGSVTGSIEAAGNYYNNSFS